jgi:hypothetical protein
VPLPLLSSRLAGRLPALLAAAAPTERIHEAAGRVLSDPALQRELPTAAVPPAVDLQPLSLPLALLLRFLAWAAVAVVLCLAAVWLVRRLTPAAGGDDPAALEPGATPLDVPLEGARALAAAGRYGEAIHALLLETLAALSKASRLAPSLTSREILARVLLPARAREALAALVLAVEVSRFGGAEPGEDDYRVCVERFETFLATYKGAA